VALGISYSNFLPSSVPIIDCISLYFLRIKNSSLNFLGFVIVFLLYGVPVIVNLSLPNKVSKCVPVTLLINTEGSPF